MHALLEERSIRAVLAAARESRVNREASHLKRKKKEKEKKKKKKEKKKRKKEKDRFIVSTIDRDRGGESVFMDKVEKCTKCK